MIIPDATLEVVEGVVEKCDRLLVELVQVRQMTKDVQQRIVDFRKLQEPACNLGQNFCTCVNHSDDIPSL